MPEITYKWLDRSRHLIEALYPRGYTWDDYHHNLDKLDEDLGEDESPLYIINQYEKGTRLPPSIISPHWRRSTRTFNVAFVVYVTEDNILRATLRNFLAVINYKLGVNYDFANTVEEAVEMLEAKIQEGEQEG